MNQPLYWSVLVGVTVVAAVGRLALGRPVLQRKARPLTRIEVALAVASLLVLVFHCAAMFFTPWTDALPGGELLGEPIRELGALSQWSYWIPATGLVLAVRRLWWPAPVSLAVTLIGVGVTMFWPYALTTHLTWLAAVALNWIVVAGTLVGGGEETTQEVDRTEPVEVG